MRFKNAVHEHDGTEKEKVAAAKLLFSQPSPATHNIILSIPKCFHCKAEGQYNQLLTCGVCTRTYFCNKQCQIDGWPKHKKQCKKYIRGNRKKNFSAIEIRSGNLLSVAMRGGGVKGVLGTILSFL